MGFYRHSKRGKSEYYRPEAKISQAKYGTDKFKDEQSLMKHLTDLEWSTAFGTFAGATGNVIEEEEGSGECTGGFYKCKYIEVGLLNEDTAACII